MTIVNIQHQSGELEKSHAALSSVLGAVVLTTFKIVVGLMTGSLGILAEAAHSGLDLVAALVTFLAVHLSGKPADSDHPYGHGKIENLSALFETLLLLITCVWIIYEAIIRLFYKPTEIDVSIWSSIVVFVVFLLFFLSLLVPSLRFLRPADAIAALGVALIVIYVTIQLGIR